jgi:uncharacterized protein YuzE
MKVKYFRDTDTALLQLLDASVESTREINEDVHVDLDSKGNVVSITIEHAGRNSQLPEISVQEFDQRTATAHPPAHSIIRRNRSSGSANTTASGSKWSGR